MAKHPPMQEPMDYVTEEELLHMAAKHNKPTLADYARAIVDTECRWCGRSLKHRRVDHYDHSDGWPVHGFDRLQWLSIKCPKCGYDWALWKLGVPRHEKD